MRNLFSSGFACQITFENKKLPSNHIHHVLNANLHQTMSASFSTNGTRPRLINTNDQRSTESAVQLIIHSSFPDYQSRLPFLLRNRESTAQSFPYLSVVATRDSGELGIYFYIFHLEWSYFVAKVEGPFRRHPDLIEVLIKNPREKSEKPVKNVFQ